MGIISIIALVFGLAFLISAKNKLKDLAKEHGAGEENEDLRWGLRWASRLAGFVSFLGLLGMVDAYVWKLPNPLLSPEAKLPAVERSQDPAALEPIPKAPKADPMGDARRDHQKALDGFDK